MFYFGTIGQMKLIFKPYPKQKNDHFEAFLQARRLERLWHEREKAIVASFRLHTGSTFQEQQITVYVGADLETQSGDKNMPMLITYNGIEHTDPDDELLRALLHELAHRLVMGNGVRSTQEAYTYSRNLLAHKRIYLFLYDVEVDVLGVETANEDVASTLQLSKRAFGGAWDWALAKSYAERQAAIRRMAKRHGRKATGTTLVQ